MLTLAFASPLFAASFKPPCKLPFRKIAAKQPIDSKCGRSGSPKDTTALTAQDTAKNNFCAVGSPRSLTFEAYPGLQAAAEKALNGQDYEPPTNRSALHNLYAWHGKKIGERTLITII